MLSTNKSPGVGAPGHEFHSDNQPSEFTSNSAASQFLYRDALGEYGHNLAAVGDMLVAQCWRGVGVEGDIEATLRLGRETLLAAIATFREMQSGGDQ